MTTETVTTDTTCARCGKRPSVHSVDVDNCAWCWTVPELDEVMIEIAFDYVIAGSLSGAEATSRLRVAVGRDLTEDEWGMWRDNCEEAKRQAAEAVGA